MPETYLVLPSSVPEPIRARVDLASALGQAACHAWREHEHRPDADCLVHVVRYAGNVVALCYLVPAAGRNVTIAKLTIP